VNSSLLSFVLLSPRMIAIFRRAQFASASQISTRWPSRNAAESQPGSSVPDRLVPFGASMTRRRQNGATVQPSEVESISIFAGPSK
jgi:hypothetical protein